MKKYIGQIISVIGFLIFQTSHAATLTPLENQIKQYVTVHTDAQFALLEQLVNMNSGTTNVAGVQRVGDRLQAEFEQLGFKTQRVAEPASMQRASTLIATRTGTKGKRVLLIGHLDTVFPDNSPFQKYKRNGNTAQGPGVIDDKGGDVVILYALKALQAAHALDDVSITVVLTGDEEDSGKPTAISRAPLIAAAKRSDIALDFEWSFGRDTATIARRGVSQWTLQTTGNEAHSSEIFQPAAGYGAVFELARILDTMRRELGQERYLSFSPGIMLGGTAIALDKSASQGSVLGKANVIAKSAVAHGDLRFLLPEQQIKAEEKMVKITKQHLPGTSATIQFQNGIPAMKPTPQNMALLSQYSEASQDLGFGSVGALDPGLRGAGDISHVAEIVSANLAGLGPVGTGAHSVKETLDVESLAMNTQRAALLIYRLTH